VAADVAEEGEEVVVELPGQLAPLLAGRQGGVGVPLLLAAEQPDQGAAAAADQQQHQTHRQQEGTTAHDGPQASEDGRPTRRGRTRCESRLYRSRGKKTTPNAAPCVAAKRV